MLGVTQSNSQGIIKDIVKRIIRSMCIYANCLLLVDEHIISARKELLKRDKCQVRPMVRSPSVPFDYSFIFLALIEQLFFRIGISSRGWLSCLCVLKHV